MYQVTRDFRVNRTGELLKKDAETNAEQFRPEELERALTRGYLVAKETLDDVVADTRAKLELKTVKELKDLADTEGVDLTGTKNKTEIIDRFIG